MERVEVYIPRAGGNEEPNLFVSVNGVNYLLPRGRKSMVPRAVAWEVDRAMEAQDVLDQRVQELAAQ